MARARTQNTTEEPPDEGTGPAPIAVRPRAQGASKKRASSGASAGRTGTPRGGDPAARNTPDAAAPLLQVVWIGGIAVSLLVSVALATSTPGTPAPGETAEIARNACGPVGERVADWLHRGFGLVAWGTPLVGVSCGLRLAGRPGGSFGSLALVGMGGVTLMGALDHALRTHVALGYPPGGVVGETLADVVRSLAGPVGTGVVLGSALLGCATLLFRINWQPLAARAVTGVQSGAPAAARALGSASVSAFRAGRDGVGALRDQLRSPASVDDEGADEADDEYEEDEEDESLDGIEEEVSVALPTTRGLAPTRPAATPPVPPAERPGAGTRAPAVPASAPPPSVRARAPDAPSARPSPDDQVTPGPAPSLWSARPAPPARAALPPPPASGIDRDAPTRVAQRTLVEVELEATNGLPIRTGNTELPRVRAGAERVSIAPRERLTVAPLVAAANEPADWARRERAERPTLAEAAATRGPPSSEPSNRHAFDPVPQRRDAAVRAADPDREATGAILELDTTGGHEPSMSLPAPQEPQVPPASLRAAPATAPASAPAVAPPVAGVELPPLAAPPRTKRGLATDVAVLPGNLQSGGSGDDGKAIRETRTFRLPPLSLLDDHPPVVVGTDETALQATAQRLLQTLREFKIEGRVSAIRPGPVITMFEFEPAAGVKLSSIVGLQDNIKMALRTVAIRIVAPLPGRGCVGIEVPNDKRQTIWARDVFASQDFTSTDRTLPMILGKDTEGRPYITDLAKMPHLLIGGTTGSGKSVGVNAMLCSMLYMRPPEELRMILIDPKMLEFALYEDIPHLLHPVVTDPKFASSVLKWVCDEMDERYRLMARWQTRNIENFNNKVDQELQDWTPEKARMYAPKDWPERDPIPPPKKLPLIVVVIDELADLMLVASSDVETSISRIVAKARASGIHLIVATQTPRRDVITGTIKANMPSSLSYQVRSGLDSRVILDEMGAETLLGKGDLLFRPPGTSVPMRIHGPFLSEGEVQRIANFLRAQGAPEYDTRIASAAKAGSEDAEEVEHDEKYDEAVNFAIERGSISTSMLQRHLGIGYNRAANIVDVMEREGVVGPADGVKPRKILGGGNS